jgi:hypothetical protein
MKFNLNRRTVVFVLKTLKAGLVTVSATVAGSSSHTIAAGERTGEAPVPFSDLDGRTNFGW